MRVRTEKVGNPHDYFTLFLTRSFFSAPSDDASSGDCPETSPIKAVRCRGYLRLVFVKIVILSILTLGRQP